jgi:hypothetical protein
MKVGMLGQVDGAVRSIAVVTKLLRMLCCYSKHEETTMGILGQVGVTALTQLAAAHKCK